MAVFLKHMIYMLGVHDLYDISHVHQLRNYFDVFKNIIVD